MKVTVADCLELEAFEGAEVVAGKLNLSNDVKSISVLDACDNDDLKFYRVNKAEIFLTGFLGIKDDVDKQCSFVRHIARRGCAALAVYYVGRAVRSLDHRVIETAERELVPLILMPAEAEYTEAITEVMDKVLYGDNFSNSLISNTVFPLLNF